MQTVKHRQTKRAGPTQTQPPHNKAAQTRRPDTQRCRTDNESGHAPGVMCRCSAGPCSYQRGETCEPVPRQRGHSSACRHGGKKRRTHVCKHTTCTANARAHTRHAHTRTHTHAPSIHACTHAHAHARTHTPARITHTHMHSRAHACTRTCPHAHTHTHAHARTQTSNAPRDTAPRQSRRQLRVFEHVHQTLSKYIAAQERTSCALGKHRARTLRELFELYANTWHAH